MDGGLRFVETGRRVKPTAVRRLGGERSATHRFPGGAAGIVKGAAVAPFTRSRAQMLYLTQEVW